MVLAPTADHKGPQVHSLRGLVVFRSSLIRDDDRAVALQRLRRGRALLVHLQRAALLPEVPQPRGQTRLATGE